MKRSISVPWFLFLSICIKTAMIVCLCGPACGADPPFIKGADISMLPRIEGNGGIYMECGVPRDPLEILKDHGINYIRLRIWHSPSEGFCNLKGTLLMAKRIRSHGLGFLLDIHYSDTWADPGKQRKPNAWNALSFDALRDSVFHYSHGIIAAMKARNTLPDMVQIGNEVTCGFLWDDGRICDQYNTPEQWYTYTVLTAEAINGVRTAASPEDSIRIMIHIDRGGDHAGSKRFFDTLLRYGVDFDIIGLSYYPWWHGKLDDLATNLDSLATKFEKRIIIAETAYPWTLRWFDGMHNIVGLPEQLHEGYPATVDGQRLFLADLLDIISRAPGGKGIGLFYWSPEYISAPSLGSPWENLTLFDFGGELLNSIDAFEMHSVRARQRGKSVQDGETHR